MKKLRQFLINVGMFTCVVVLLIWCLNLAFHRDELRCVNEDGWLGLATKYSDRINLQMAGPDGQKFERFHDEPGTPMHCGILFGEGWRNAEYR